MFAIYLSTLKHQLSLYNDEHKWIHLFIKLKFELHVIIINVQLISIIWNALIDLVAQLKINLQEEHVLSLKQFQDRNSYDQTKINKISNETHLYMMLTTNLLFSYSKV